MSRSFVACFLVFAVVAPLQLGCGDSAPVVNSGPTEMSSDEIAEEEAGVGGQIDSDY